MKPDKILMKDLLANYSKEILIKYILNRWAYDDRTKFDLDWLHYEAMAKTASAMMDRSIKGAELSKGNIKKWLKFQNDFDDAQRAWDEADKFYKKNCAGGYEPQEGDEDEDTRYR